MRGNGLFFDKFVNFYAGIVRQTIKRAVACSQVFTGHAQPLYFLFKVRRARVIKYKNREDLLTASGGGKKKIDAPSSPMFTKRTKRKLKQRVCTG